MSKFIELGIFVTLLDGNPHSASEFAQLYEVSTKTIYRKINSLLISGLPVTTIMGKNGGIILNRNKTFDTSFFTEQELGYIFNLVKSNKTLSPVLSQDISSKLINHINNQNLNTAEKMSDIFYVDNSSWFKTNLCKDNIYDTYLEACKNKNQLKIKYSSVEELRIINPYCIVQKQDCFYLYAFCNTKNQFRLFKLSKINNVEVLKTNFKKQSIDLSTMPWNTANKYSQIKINITPQFLKEISSWALINNFENNIATITVVNNAGLIHKIMQYGDNVKILEPLSLAQDLVQECKKIANNYVSAL